jgi:Domain of unknown function (DUF1707)/Cell wall-active antibiotics response 4TMS YvqF
VTAAEQPPGPGDQIRVSDQERNAALDLLGEHAAAGRLTVDELEDRASQALAAKTRGDLAALTSDLPQAGAPVARRKPVRWMVAVLSGSNQRGRYRLAGTLNAVSILGGDQIDLRDAEISDGEVTVNAVSILGGPTIYLPDTVNVEVEGMSIIGGNSELGTRSRPRPGAPLVRIRTYNLLGGSTIWRLPPEARGLPLREARRLAKAAGRGELPAAER